MDTRRKPFEGLINILRFNWHFYLIAFGLLICCFIALAIMPIFPFQRLVYISLIIAICPILLSLIVSYYVYDVSNLYNLPWTENLNSKKVLNINSGFDETSSVLIAKYKHIELTIADFYNPELHTEISIKRARKIYPPTAETIKVDTTKLPFADDTFDYIHIAFSAHEIRNENERVEFFKEIRRISKKEGTIAVTEHLRDFNNFCAYTIGFFHFHAKNSWLNVFEKANLRVVNELKTTAFITTFNLKDYGDTL